MVTVVGSGGSIRSSPVDGKARFIDRGKLVLGDHLEQAGLKRKEKRIENQRQIQKVVAGQRCWCSVLRTVCAGLLWPPVQYSCTADTRLWGPS